MEAVRLLSSGPTAHVAGIAAEHNLIHDIPTGLLPVLTDQPAVSSATWDAALVQTRLADLLAAPSSATAPGSTSAVSSDPSALASGLAQLNKYLNRAWYRAGIPVQLHEDSSQAVYATLLQHLGRARFDSLVSDVGHFGIKEVFTRETNEGVAFFRAVDMVKKRAQRERAHQSLETVESPTSSGASDSHGWSEALREAIDLNLSPREASLINDTLMGKTPAEIALHWGVAPKTISNEKTRVLQKLRDVLLAQSTD
jgi:DNA-binding CsgD family transcriptional regulator